MKNTYAEKLKKMCRTTLRWKGTERTPKEQKLLQILSLPFNQTTERLKGNRRRFSFKVGYTYVNPQNLSCQLFFNLNFPNSNPTPSSKKGNIPKSTSEESAVIDGQRCWRRQRPSELFITPQFQPLDFQSHQSYWF